MRSHPLNLDNQDATLVSLALDMAIARWKIDADNARAIADQSSPPNLGMRSLALQFDRQIEQACDIQGRL